MTDVEEQKSIAVASTLLYCASKMIFQASMRWCLSDKKRHLRDISDELESVASALMDSGFPKEVE